MTAFAYDNLPDEMMIAPLAPQYTLTALDILREAIRSGSDVAAEAKIGFAYDRKGTLTVDEIAPLSGEYNAYNRDRDDVLVQVTIRMDRGDKDSRFSKLESHLIEDATNARIAAYRAELASIEADEAALAERKRKAQELADKIGANLAEQADFTV